MSDSAGWVKSCQPSDAGRSILEGRGVPRCPQVAPESDAGRSAYLEQAARLRGLAAETTSAWARKLCLELAESYEKLTDSAEVKAPEQPKQLGR